MKFLKLIFLMLTAVNVFNLFTSEKIFSVWNVDFSLSPNKKFIIMTYNLRHSQERNEAKSFLVLGDLEKREFKKIKESQDIMDYVQWLPNSEKIFYRNGWAVVMYDIIRKKEEKILICRETDKIAEFIGVPKLSPSGKKIGIDIRKISKTSFENDMINIWIMDIESKEMVQITKDGIGYWGGWGWISEEEILYSKKEGSIWISNVNTNKQKEILPGFNIVNMGLAISKSQKMIIFNNPLDRKYYLFDISNNMIIFHGNGYICGSEWSPDDNLIIYKKCQDKERNKCILLRVADRKEQEVYLSKENGILPSFEWFSKDEIVFCSESGDLFLKKLWDREIEKLFDLNSIIGIHNYKNTYENQKKRRKHTF